MQWQLFNNMFESSCYSYNRLFEGNHGADVARCENEWHPCFRQSQLTSAWEAGQSQSPSMRHHHTTMLEIDLHAFSLLRVLLCYYRL